MIGSRQITDLRLPEVVIAMTIGWRRYLMKVLMGRPMTNGGRMHLTTNRNNVWLSYPPWFNIDPIAPARIRLRANAQRNEAAASRAAAQAQAEELQFRREALQAQQAQAAGREAADERAALRRDQVLRQTHDSELAQAAQQMQLRREAQAQKSQQFQQTLRLKQEAAEREAKSAAQQMQGMKAVQAGLQKGEPLQKLIAENAPMLFAKHPERIPSAVPRGVTGPSDFTARQLRDEQGNPMGINVIPGAHGSIKTLPRTTMSPEGMLRADQLRLGVISRQLEEETDPAKAAQLTRARDGIMARLEQITSGRGAAPAPAGNAQTPAAASAPPSDVVRVKSPSGKTGTIPRAQLDAALKAGYTEIAPETGAPDFTEEQDALDEEEE